MLSNFFVRVKYRSKICKIAFRTTTFRLIGTSDKLIYPKDEPLAQCSDVTIEKPNKMGEWVGGAYAIPTVCRLVFLANLMSIIKFTKLSWMVQMMLL